MSVGLPTSNLGLCHGEKEFCKVCIEAKQIRNPFNSERDRAVKPLHIIHTDIVGPIEPLTYDNKKYVLTFVDDYTHFCKVYLLKNKSEAFQYLKEYVSEAEAFFNIKAAKLRLDNGGEYVSLEMKQWCKDKGIVLDYTVPHTPQLNGTAERMNRTLFEKARALIFDANLSKQMWGEAIVTSAYLLNRSPTVTIDTTPAEKWYGKIPDLSRLQIFGSVCYAKRVGPKKKLDSRTNEAIFLGYGLNSYRLWDPIKKKIFMSRDVVFSQEVQTHKTNEQVKKEILLDEDGSNDKKQESVEIQTEYQSDSLDSQDNTENELGLTENNRLIESNANDTVTGHQPYNLRVRTNIKRPQRYDSCESVLCDGQIMLTYDECLNSADKDKWKAAIESEKESLRKNNTWKLVEEKQVDGKEILTSRWVFKIKDNGSYKARLVVRGCQQNKEHIDFKDTFSPVVESSSLRLLFAIAAQENLHIQTFDVKTAFLYGHIEEEIYVKLPEGYEDETGKICRLQKALYGLKQAPSQWNKRLTSLLKDEGLIQLKADQCIFKEPNNEFYLAIHVDDGIIMGKSPVKIQNLLKKLEKEFEMTINKNPSMYLGMEVTQNSNGIFLSQRSYAKQIIDRYNMIDSKSAKTPIEPYENNSLVNEEAEIKFPYREAVGSLLYMTNKTRPDITYAVNYESRFMENPTKQDVQNVKRTLRYLKETQNFGIFYSSRKSDKISIEAFCDSDYAGDTKDRKSTSGYVLMYAGGPISWISRKQPIVALSTAEAEYISAAECCKEISYITTLISELKNQKVETILYIDNQSALKLIKSGQMNRKSKHIDVRYHYVSEQYHRGLFQVKYCNSENQLADILTKPLLGNKFNKFSNMLQRNTC